MGEHGPAQRLLGDVAVIHLFVEDGGKDEIRLGGVVECSEQDCVRAEPSEPVPDGDRLPERHRGERPTSVQQPCQPNRAEKRVNRPNDLASSPVRPARRESHQGGHWFDPGIAHN